MARKRSRERGKNKDRLANRRHKDTVFKDIFGSEKRKRYALSLYNALNGTGYEDPDALEFNTLDNVLYLGMHNDVSFVIGDEQNVWEHQSTLNPNMPLRVLKYVARLYENLIEKKEEDEYGKRLIMLPTPRAVVFYIGTEDRPDIEIMRLSDSFSGSGDVEVTVTAYNINEGHNKELMERCEALRGYSHMVARVRAHGDEGMSPEESINAALDDCIGGGIFEEYFVERRAEVADIFMSEYDEERVREIAAKANYRWGHEDGFAEGHDTGFDEGLLAAVKGLVRRCGWSADEAMDVVDIPEDERPRYVALLARP
jgi:hypothetical protein